MKKTTLAGLVGSTLAVVGIVARVTGPWGHSNRENQAVLLSVAHGSVEVARRGTGPAVLVLHGTPGAYEQALWLGEDLLSYGLQIIAPSRPGYSRSTSQGSLEEQATALREALDSLEVERFGVLAWSGGAPVAVELATRYPDRVASLVLLAPALEATPMPDRPPGTASITLARWLLRLWPRSVASRVGQDEAVARRLITERAADSRMDRLLSTLAKASNDTAGRQHDYETLASFSFNPQEIRTPLLVVQGALDHRVSPGLVAQAAASVTGAAFLSLPTAGHLLPLHPDYPRAHIAAFLHRGLSRTAPTATGG